MGKLLLIRRKDAQAEDAYILVETNNYRRVVDEALIMIRSTSAHRHLTLSSKLRSLGHKRREVETVHVKTCTCSFIRTCSCI